jgi:hypothetical protein
MSSATKAILTNNEAIAINQDSMGVQGRKISDDGDHEVYVKPMNDSSKAVVMFNRGDDAATMEFTLHDIGMSVAKAYVRDVWVHAEKGAITSSYSASVGSHDVVMVRVRPYENTTIVGQPAITPAGGVPFALSAGEGRIIIKNVDAGTKLAVYDIRGVLIRSIDAASGGGIVSDGSCSIALPAGRYLIRGTAQGHEILRSAALIR